MPEFEERLQRGLRDLAEDFPPYAQVPRGLLRRARRGMVVSTLVIVLAVAAVGTAAALGIGALGIHRPVPVVPPPPPMGTGLIAFARTPAAGGPATAWSDIYVMRADGTGVRRLLGNSRSAYQGPAWSPDGTRIALVANPNNAFAGEGELAVMDADGTHLRLVPRASAVSSPAWSPDGRWIAFTNGQGAAIDVVNANGTGLRQVVPGPSPKLSTNVGEPAWSPDGSQIAFVAGPALQGSIYVVSSNGTGLRRLTPGPGDSFPAWSPSGDEVAFARDAGRASGIYTVGADGRHPRRLTVCRLPCVWASAPTWSPGGRRIAFEESMQRGRSQQIFVLDIANGRVRQLTSGPLDNVDPSWQPGLRSPSRPTTAFHVARGSRPGWKRYIDPFYRVSVEVPDSWTVHDPSSGPLGAYTVVAAGSWRFPVGQDQYGCAPRPALNALPRNGAFIWWQEQGSGFPPRPKAFRFPKPTAVECVGGPTYLIDFRAGGRYFQVQVRLGPGASKSMRRTVLQVLDGFRAEKG